MVLFVIGCFSVVGRCRCCCHLVILVNDGVLSVVVFVRCVLLVVLLSGVVCVC